jgi:hypothetical protein
MKAFALKWAAKVFLYLWKNVVLDLIRDYVNGKLDPTGEKDNSVVIQGKIDRDGGVNLPEGTFRVDHTIDFDTLYDGTTGVKQLLITVPIVLISPSGDKWSVVVDDYGQLITKLQTETQAPA